MEQRAARWIDADGQQAAQHRTALTAQLLAGLRHG